MLWIKRNLLLVIGIVVSLALLGGAGYYLYNNSQENFDRDDELDKLKVELEQLKGGVFPSQPNIAFVKSNTAAIQGFMVQGERVFTTDTIRVPGETQIKVGLANLVDTLRRDATNAGVEVPPKYEFTYGEVKVMPRLPSYAIEPLTNQLKEVRSICTILFNAKVPALESLQRGPAFAGEPPSADILTDRVTQTNTLSTNISVVITPYRLVFRGFSSHLTEVMNSLTSAKEFYAVRQVDVEPYGGAMETPGLRDPTGMTTMPGFGPMGAPGLPGTTLPFSPNGDQAPRTREALIETAVSRLFTPNGDNKLALIRFTDGKQREIHARELVSGRLIEQICKAARMRAFQRDVNRGDPGLRIADMEEAADEAIQRLRTTLTRENAHHHLADLPQDVQILAVDAVQPRVAQPRRYLTQALP
ncbi:MAG: hypothetical protein ABMA26_11480 [Limisphaerales bacterium]